LNPYAISGSIGELLSHNIFAYCNNNSVNGKDPNGFRTIYTQGEETVTMRDDSYNTINIYRKRKGSDTSTVTNSKEIN